MNILKIHPACSVTSFCIFFAGLVFTSSPAYGLAATVLFIAVLTRMQGRRSVINIMKFSLFYIITGSIINIFVSSNGSTILFRSARIPIVGRIDATLEEVLFSISMGVRIMGMFALFKVYALATDPDSAFDFFSRRMRKLTLTTSLISNMMHNLSGEIERISSVMKLRGVDFSHRNIIERARNFYFMTKVVIVSSLEGSIDYSQAIYSKGYPSESRTSYSEANLSRRDIVLLWLGALNAGVLIWMCMSGSAQYSFYPRLQRLSVGNMNAGVAALVVAAVHFEFFWRIGCSENI